MNHDLRTDTTLGCRAQPVVLVFAFSCEPGKGSEPGAGWGMLMAIKSIAQPVVLMRPDSMDAVRAWIATDDGPKPEFVVVDEPPWVSRVRDNRIAAFLVYLSWLRRAETVAREIVASRRIDLVHHITYSAYWLPTPAVHLGVPSVWGPVGGAVRTPGALIGFLGLRGRITEWIDRWAVQIAEALPATRRTWRAASIRVAQNRQTLRRIERVTDRNSVLFNHAVLHVVDPVAITAGEEDVRYIVWLSAMDSRKGPELVVRALAEAGPSVHLVMAGGGPELTRMQRLTVELAIEHQIEFVGRVDHGRALELMAGARAAVFTGAREEGGLALAEALYLGTPTIVLDHGGPAVIARSAAHPEWLSLISVHSKERTISELAAAMVKAMEGEWESRQPILDRAVARDTLQTIYLDALGLSPSPVGPDVNDVQYPRSENDEADSPAISVVTAAYNAEQFLGESIESVLGQTFADLELIVVDDGSTDRTWEIIQQYAAKDDRIRPIRNEMNMGVARSLNRGIEFARAPLIGRIDADDVCLPERFERQVQAMNADPDLVVSGTFLQYINVHGDVLGLSEAGPASEAAFSGLRSIGEPTMVMGGTALMRREVFVTAGGFDPGFRSAEDLDLFSRMAQYGNVIAIPEPLVLYRIHRESAVINTFFEGRRNHRLVQHREVARLTGTAPMSREQFVMYEENLPALTRLGTRRKDVSHYLYRLGGLGAAEGRQFKAAGYVVAAGVLAPAWVVRRMWSQQGSVQARTWKSTARR